MNCPYCEQALAEASPACPACGFSITVADQMFGLPPAFQVGVADAAQVFSTSETSQLKKELHDFERRFPQTKISVVTSNLPPTIPLKAFSFWMFNRAGVCMQMHKGHASRTLLMVLDAQGRNTSLMIGYGLEPFIGPAHLDHIAAAMSPKLAAGKFGAAALDGIEFYGNMLEVIWGELGTRYGLDMEAIQIEEAKKLGIDVHTASRALAKTDLVEY